MAAPSSPSFIPKQPATGKVKKRSTRKVYVLAYISFVFFFGTLIAGAGTLFYSLSVNSQLEAEQRNLVELRNQFNQADFERVKQLSSQIESAQTLLNRHVSILQVLEDLEASTIATVQLTDFSVERFLMGNVNLSVKAQTEDFNSVLFQREKFSQNPVLSQAELKDLKAEPRVPTDIEKNDPFFNPEVIAEERLVTFLIDASLPVQSIGYQPRDLGIAESEIVEPEPEEVSENDSFDGDQSTDGVTSESVDQAF